MKLIELIRAIDSLKDAYGTQILQQEVYMDFTFSNEIMVYVGQDAVTSVVSIPSKED